MREGRPEAAPRDATERRRHDSTSPRRESAFMKDTSFWINWLDAGHRHWWIRDLEWRERGRVA